MRPLVRRSSPSLHKYFCPQCESYELQSAGVVRCTQDSWRSRDIGSKKRGNGTCISYGRDGRKIPECRETSSRCHLQEQSGGDQVLIPPMGDRAECYEPWLCA